ncbi:hypothetical protein SAMN04487792_1634 [Lactobacillus bombicola]|uniref:Uncharacterized protein n=1 Tax=Lactobacillus bombicola TaxID=1505723 RepID=A0A1I1TYF5_9LACO|nr:hypothetical protein SAMN04487792_1634 [Lactobacillus bombicola]
MTNNKRKKELKLYNKHRYRNKYLACVGLVLAIFLIIIGSPYWTGKSVDTEQITNIVTGNSSLHLADSVYNPDTGNMLLEYYIGDSTNITSTSDDTALSNIKYATRVIDTQHGGEEGTRLNIKTIKVNNHFLVIEIKNIKKGFGILKVDFLPQKVNQKIKMQDFTADNFIQLFIKENKILFTSTKVIKTTQDYILDYRSYMSKWNKKHIAKEQNKISNANATIKSDEENLQQAKDKLERMPESQKDNIRTQITDLSTDITEQKQIITASKKMISKYQDAISAIEKGSFDK